MIVIKPPEEIKPSPNSLFLAGSIEMGEAENWQQKAEQLLSDTDWVVFNPRRDSWNNSWIQSKDNPQFREQVEWELHAQEAATKILMYFDPLTKSSISLLELGAFGRDRDKMVVVCPEGFWRKGNVDIFCERYSIKQADSIEETVKYLKKTINNYI